MASTRYVLLLWKVPHAFRAAALSPPSLLLKPSISTFCFSIFPFHMASSRGFVWQGGESEPGGHFGPSVRSLSCFPRRELIDICFHHHTDGSQEEILRDETALLLQSSTTLMSPGVYLEPDSRSCLWWEMLLVAWRLHCIMSSHPHSGS